MPSWSDDAGNCHFDVNGTPCYLSKTGCPMHKGEWAWRSPTKATRQADIDAAFKRGVAAMREAAAAHFEELAWQQRFAGDFFMSPVHEASAQRIRALPDPEDTP